MTLGSIFLTVQRENIWMKNKGKYMCTETITTLSKTVQHWLQRTQDTLSYSNSWHINTWHEKMPLLNLRCFSLKTVSGVRNFSRCLSYMHERNCTCWNSLFQAAIKHTGILSHFGPCCTIKETYRRDYSKPGSTKKEKRIQYNEHDSAIAKYPVQDVLHFVCSVSVASCA